MNIDNLDEFTRAYLECALWSSTDDETPLDEEHDITDISEECMNQMIADCAKFQAENWDMIAEDLSQAGHDFWLTRNGHGCGFWDGDWPEYGDILTAKCKEFDEHGGILVCTFYDKEAEDEIRKIMAYWSVHFTTRKPKMKSGK